MEYKAVFFRFKQDIFFSLQNNNDITKPKKLPYPEMFLKQLTDDGLDDYQLSLCKVELFDGTEPKPIEHFGDNLTDLFFKVQEYNRLDLFENDSDQTLTFKDEEEVKDTPRLLAVSLLPTDIYVDIFSQLLNQELYFINPMNNSEE